MGLYTQALSQQTIASGETQAVVKEYWKFLPLSFNKMQGE
jgi:hypothetical protein